MNAAIAEESPKGRLQLFDTWKRLRFADTIELRAARVQRGPGRPSPAAVQFISTCLQ